MSVTLSDDEYDRLLESAENDLDLHWCEVCGAWLTSEEAATVPDFTGCWWEAMGGTRPKDKDTCVRHRGRPKMREAEGGVKLRRENALNL